LVICYKVFDKGFHKNTAVEHIGVDNKVEEGMVDNKADYM
jgi:hypothetical protein